MIAGIFHEGSGLGNQLHRYVATRVLAKDKGYELGMFGDFKGESFISLEYKRLESIDSHPGMGNFFHRFDEKKVVMDACDIRPYDPEINFVKDGAIIDGEFQDPRYFEHRLDEVREWLKVEPLEMPDDLCVIGFRGGEYVGVPGLFLPQSYWDEAISQMREKYPNMRFQVHTDDVETAQSFFPDFECIHDISLNWRSVRYAKHLIIANSSFYILPALLNQDAKEVIAPKFWAGHNKGFWQLPQNYYKQFTYL